MVWLGGGAFVAGVVATLVLAGRWGARSPSAGWSRRFAAAFLAGAPLAVGWVLWWVLIAAGDGGFVPALPALCLGGIALAYLVTAAAYLPYFQWTARVRQRRSSELRA